jgi:hypothetical protein
MAGLTELVPPPRDGTSRAARGGPALDPASAALDGRGLVEHLAFAHALAPYVVDVDDADRPRGDWRAFLDGIGAPGGIPVADLAAFLSDPASLPAARTSRLRRPHLTLFWTFLRLLEEARRGVDGLMARHRDHHFRDVLRLSRAPAVADELFVLLATVPRLPALALPIGLRLAAGRDSGGRARAYALTKPVIVTPARIAEIRSVFVEKKVVGLAEARDSFTGTPAQRTLFLLTIALGSPRPGDPLPTGAPGQPVRDVATQGPYDETYAAAIGTWLGKVGAAIGFAPASLHLQLFELRQIVLLKARRAANTPGDRAAINAALQAAGRARTGDPAWTLPPGNDPANFAANFAAACGGQLPLGELPDVDSLEELAAQSGREDVREFFARHLAFFPLPDFLAMMARKIAIDSDWRIINGLLQEAARRRLGNPTFVLPIAQPEAFAANLEAALGGAPPFSTIALAPVANIDALAALIAALEAWFALPAEEIAPLVATLTAPESGTGAASPADWERARQSLGRAHAERIYAERRRAITALREMQGLGAALALVTDQVAAPGAIAAMAERATSYLDPGEAEALAGALDAAQRGATPAIGWPATDALLERAQRRRERLPVPVPVRETWRNLHARRDATAMPVKDAPWPLFGAPPADPTVAPEPLIGWAMGSPLLALGGGARSIALTLTFRDDEGAAVLRARSFGPFRLALSTAKGWFTPAAAPTLAFPAPVAGSNLRAVRLSVALAAADPPLAPPPEGDPLAGSPVPLVRLMLEPVQDLATRHWSQAYDAHRGLRLASLGIDIAVAAADAAGNLTGLHPLAVETDAGSVDGGKPFLPFGPTPGIGASVAFGHPELLGKPLTQVTLLLAWLGAPTKIVEHFRAYDSALPPVAEVALVDQGGAVAAPLAGTLRAFDTGTGLAFRAADGTPLFGTTDAAKPVAIEAAIDPQQPVPPAAGDDGLPASVRAWPRHLRLTLTPRDFGHAAYPVIAARKAVELAIALRPGGSLNGAAEYVVPPPYSPRLKLAGLGYRAARTTAVTALAAEPGVGERLHHLHPFGQEVLTAAADLPLLPEYDDEGELYLGIAKVTPPQSLPVLMQLAPGSGDLSLDPPPVRWSVLGSAGWVPLVDTLSPEDETAGLVRSGIIGFRLPEAAPPAPRSRLPPGLVWLRASVARDSAALGSAVALHAQAARARLVEKGGDAGVAPDHYATALPAGTVKGPVAAVPGLASVRQPYPSFGGRPAEKPEEFATRVAERLRHRGRAIAAWDYEHLVLAKFPEVYKAKCLAARADDPPGLVRLIVIPDLRGGGADPLRPRASPALLTAIAEHLAPRMPPTAKLEVRNPRFVEVKVRVAVRFLSDRDPGFDAARLQEAISRYLSPWAYGDGEDIVIGRRIYANSLVAFIDGRDYVDFVGSVRLFTSTDGEDFTATDGDSAVAEADDAVLIAAPRHEIDLIGDELEAQSRLAGIGYMRIELDFRVAEVSS